MMHALMQCVVETGTPMWLAGEDREGARGLRREALQRPEMRMIFVPIVLMIRQPPA